MSHTTVSHDRDRVGWEIIDSLRMGVILIDQKGRILDLNDAACRLLGLSRQSILGRPASDSLPRGGVVSEVIRQTLADKRAVTDRIGSPHGEDEPCTFRCRSMLLRSDKKDDAILACHFEDVSDIANMEAEVKQLDRLATIGRFASGIAHEIRNPLMGIYAGVQYLQKTIVLDSPEQTTTFKIIRDEVERLNRIVSDLLGAAKMPDPELREVDPNSIPAKVVTLLKDEAAEKGIRICFEPDDSLPPIGLDPDLAHQVLLNLVRNAMQASPDNGTVTISISLSATNPSAGFLPGDAQGPGLEFRVRDEGPGVPDKSRETIFEPFQTTKKSGTGLGLYVSYQIMEKHGGALWVEDDEGKGAVFTARFRYGIPVTPE